MWMLFSLLAAAVCGLALYKMRLPAGMLVGSIIGAATLNIVTGQACIVPEAKVAAQILTGAYVGSLMEKSDLQKLPLLLKPYIAVMLILFTLSFWLGWVIYSITDVDLMTALLCSMPGGLTDAPLIALDVNADSSAVALLQLVRMLFSMTCVPSVIHFVGGKSAGNEGNSMPPQSPKTGSQKESASISSILTILGIATIAGILGKVSGVKAGALSFAMIATIICKLNGLAQSIPVYYRRIAQVLSGCCVGVSVGLEQILQLRQMLIPSVILCIAYLLCCVGAGTIISKVFSISQKEGMLFLYPSGTSELALIAADIGVYSPNLIVLQLFRMLGVLFLFPNLYAGIVSLFNL